MCSKGVERIRAAKYRPCSGLVSFTATPAAQTVQTTPQTVRPGRRPANSAQKRSHATTVVSPRTSPTV